MMQSRLLQYRLFRISPAIAVIVTMLSTGSATGSVFKSGGSIQISNLHVIDDDMYIAAGKLTFDGTVNGDLIVWASESTVRGEVSESAILAGENIRVSGNVNGSLRAFGANVNIEGNIGRSADLFAYTAKLGEGSVVEQNVTVFGQAVYLEGAVRGDVTVEARYVHIAGLVNGDATITADRISLAPSAVINGRLTYSSESEDSLAVAAGAIVMGGIRWEPPEVDESETTYTRLILRVASMLASFIFGIIVVRLFRPYAEESFSQLHNRFVVSSAAGLVGLVCFFLCLLVLLISLLFLTAGLLIIVLSSKMTGLGMLFLVFSILMIPITSFTGITGGIILYSGVIVIAYLIGYLIARLFKPLARPLSAGSLLIGLVVLLILFSLPYVGNLLYILGTIIGAGAILNGIRHCRREKTPPAQNGTPEASAGFIPED